MNIKSLRSLSIEEAAFYLAFGIQSWVFFMGLTSFETIIGLNSESVYSLLQIVVVFLLMMKLLVQIKTVSQFLMTLLIVSIAFITYKTSGLSNLLWISLFVCSSKGVKLKKLAFVALFVSASVLIQTVAYSLAGVITNVVLNGDGMVGVRTSLGFRHPNYLGQLVLTVCISVLVLRDFRLSVLTVLTLALGIIAIDSSAGSRTSMIALFVALAIMVLSKMGLFVRGKRSAFFACIIIAFICLLSLYLMMEFDSGNGLHQKLDALFSYRFSLSNISYKYHPFSIMGCDFADAPMRTYGIGESNFVVDNAYCRLFLRYGILPFLLFVSAYELSIFKGISKGEGLAVAIGLLVMGIVGFTEKSMIDLSTNYFLILAFSWLLGINRESTGFLKKDIDNV